MVRIISFRQAGVIPSIKITIADGYWPKSKLLFEIIMLRLENAFFKMTSSIVSNIIVPH